MQQHIYYEMRINALGYLNCFYFFRIMFKCYILLYRCPRVSCEYCSRTSNGHCFYLFSTLFRQIEGALVPIYASIRPYLECQEFVYGKSCKSLAREKYFNRPVSSSSTDRDVKSEEEYIYSIT